MAAPCSLKSRLHKYHNLAELLITSGEKTDDLINKVFTQATKDQTFTISGTQFSVQKGDTLFGQHPNQWSYTTWKYGDYGSYERARFRFSGEHDSLVLNDFDIDREDIW